jgi:hypothetical protein
MMEPVRWATLVVVLAGCNLVHDLEDPGPHVRVIDIDPQTTAELHDFPVSIVVTDADLARRAASNGKDIHFTDAAGKALPYEIVSYQSGALEAWVRVSLAGPTSIHLVYGTEAPVHDPADTWSSLYAGVWHLGDTGVALDSTAQHRDLAPPGDGPDVGPGIVGSARTFDEAHGIRAVCGPTSIVDPDASFSYAAWVQFGTMVGPYDAPVDAFGFIGQPGGFALVRSAGGVYGQVSDGTKLPYAYFNDTPSTTWASFVVVVDRTANQLRTYHDGAFDGMADLTGVGPVTNEVALCLPGQVDGFTGSIDELRVYTDVLSPDWIRAEYSNVEQRGMVVILH